MFVVVITPNKDGKIEMSKEELQDMLNNAYNKGYIEGKSKSFDTTTVPSYPVYYRNNQDFEHTIDIKC